MVSHSTRGVFRVTEDHVTTTTGHASLRGLFKSLDVDRLRLAFLLCFRLQTGVATRGELVLELLNATRRVDVLELTRIERMAAVANINLQFLARAARLE